MPLILKINEKKNMINMQYPCLLCTLDKIIITKTPLDHFTVIRILLLATFIYFF